MKYSLVAIFALVASAVARPQAPAAPAPAAFAAHHQQPQSDSSTPATIISQSEDIEPDGSFKYSFETSNGIKVEESGSVKPNPEAKSADPNKPDEDNAEVQVVQGSFSYTAPDGQEISVKYIADDKGFQPEGAHLPTAPPLPEGIARSLGQTPDHPEAQALVPQGRALQAAAPVVPQVPVTHPEAQSTPAQTVAQPLQTAAPANPNPSPVPHA